MKRLLLVEDDRSLGATLHGRLKKEQYQVSWVETAKDAQEKIKLGELDLVILDVGLPDGSGFELGEFVKSTTAIPIIFVTAMSSAEYRLKGFEIGAEEFIPKPFHLKELLLRIEHVLEKHPARREVQVGKLKIDFEAMAIVQEGGEKEYPQSRDFRVLKYLIESAPRVVSRDEILNRIWGEDKFPSHRTVDNTIVRLRQHLADEKGKYIRSVRGIGYQWSQAGGNSNE